MGLATCPIYNGIKNFIFEADLDKKVMIQSNYVCPLLCAAYFFGVSYLGRRLMKNREPFQLKYTLIFYNCAMVAINFHMAFGFITSMRGMFMDTLCPSDPKEQGIKVLKGLKPFAWYYFLVKHVEFLDSFFFVLRKKFHLLTILHRFHHALTPLACLIIARGDLNFCVYIMVTVNSIVHVFMYFYYGLAACGPQFRKFLWWKKFLTTFQILQLVAVLICLLLNPLTGCFPTRKGEIVAAFLSFCFLGLFINYYFRQYIAAKEKQK